MRYRATSRTGLALRAIVLGALVAAVSTQPGYGGETAAKANRWRSTETTNFVVWHTAADRVETAKHVAQSCEQKLRELRDVWVPDSLQMAWDAKCHIVLHRRLGSYLAAVGREAAQTFGSSVVDRKQQRIVLRRIDLRIDARTETYSALAHELTHVVLADRLSQARLPVWADEGLALLADSDDKQLRHLRDLDDAVIARNHFHTFELLALEGYPGAGRWGTFYGQSASLVQFFLDQGTPDQLMKFLELAGKSGYDAALRTTYGIRDSRDLDQRWRAYHATSRSGVYALDRTSSGRGES